jgi:hypothetical protein
MRNLSSISFVVLACMSRLAQAEEPRGCDKFKWPIVHEQQALNAPQVVELASGGNLPIDMPASIKLTPVAQAKFELPPERTPKDPASFAGILHLEAPTKDGSFKVSISTDAWIDAIQDGQLLKSTAFTGAFDCTGIRKSVKFSLQANPVTIQLSDVRSPRISIVVTHD